MKTDIQIQCEGSLTGQFMPHRHASFHQQNAYEGL